MVVLLTQMVEEPGKDRAKMVPFWSKRRSLLGYFAHRNRFHLVQISGTDLPIFFEFFLFWTSGIQLKF
jgi:hypothetical protein